VYKLLVFKIHKNLPTIIYNFKIFRGYLPGRREKGGEKRRGRGKRGGKRRKGRRDFGKGQNPHRHFSGYRHAPAFDSFDWILQWS
jgi:hypothetical protein